MNKPVFTPFRERLTELLAHPECHAVILHLHNPDVWPLPCSLDEYVSALNGDVRSLAEFILMNIEDPSFQTCAQALEQATIKVEAEQPCQATNRVEVVIEH